MKTFKIYFLLILFICINYSAFAQDEIYNERVKKVIVVVDSNQTDELLIEKTDSTIADSTLKNVSINNLDEYYTEGDYYIEKYGERKKKGTEVEVYTEDDELGEERNERRDANGEVIVAIAEVVVEVFFNVFLFFALGN